MTKDDGTEDVLDGLYEMVKQNPKFLTSLENFVKNQKRNSNKLPFRFQGEGTKADNVTVFPSKIKVTREFIVAQILDRLSCLDHDGLVLYNERLNGMIEEDGPPKDAA